MKIYLVFKDDEQVGMCYIIEYEGVLREPTLVDNDGKNLKTGNYLMYEMINQLVVVSETIQ